MRHLLDEDARVSQLQEGGVAREHEEGLRVIPGHIPCPHHARHEQGTRTVRTIRTYRTEESNTRIRAGAASLQTCPVVDGEQEMAKGQSRPVVNEREGGKETYLSSCGWRERHPPGLAR